MLIVGLMSGTSADGVDAALVDLQGNPPSLKWKLLGHTHYAYSPEVQSDVLACARLETGNVAALCRVNFLLAELFSKAALQVIEQCGLRPEQVDLIGSHGQTVWYIPTGPDASTFQIGEAAVIAERTGITTIHNFRARDMAAGGLGAPLSSFTDVLLFTHPVKVRACQNLGGIGNLTFMPPANRQDLLPLAFDTGPANMLIDDAVRRLSSGVETFDRDGKRALRGRVVPGLLERWVKEEPYYAQRPPKTTGRELYTRAYGDKLWQQAQELNRSGIKVSDDDFIATLTALTAQTVADAYHHFLPLMPEEIIVSGGGALNPVLMGMLRDRLAPARLFTSDEMGLPTEAKEAAAFAVLAYQTWHNRPSTLPSATGARHPSVLGSITPGKNWASLER